MKLKLLAELVKKERKCHRYQGKQVAGTAREEGVQTNRVAPRGGGNRTLLTGKSLDFFFFFF